MLRQRGAGVYFRNTQESKVLQFIREATKGDALEDLELVVVKLLTLAVGDSVAGVLVDFKIFEKLDHLEHLAEKSPVFLRRSQRGEFASEAKFDVFEVGEEESSDSDEYLEQQEEPRGQLREEVNTQLEHPLQSTHVSRIKICFFSIQSQGGWGPFGPKRPRVSKKKSKTEGKKPISCLALAVGLSIGFLAVTSGLILLQKSLPSLDKLGLTTKLQLEAVGGQVAPELEGDKTEAVLAQHFLLNALKRVDEKHDASEPLSLGKTPFSPEAEKLLKKRVEVCGALDNTV
jgi:hypothetical protein